MRSIRLGREDVFSRHNLEEVKEEMCHMIVERNNQNITYIFREIKGAFGCGKFPSFLRNIFKENENLENAYGSFRFQKFSKKMKIFYFLTSM